MNRCNDIEELFLALNNEQTKPLITHKIYKYSIIDQITIVNRDS